MAHQLQLIGVVLLLSGCGALFRINRGILAIAGVAVASVVVSTILYLDLPPDQLRLLGIFLLPATTALAVVAVYGAGNYARGMAMRGVVVVFLLLGSFLGLKSVDVREFTWSYDLARAMLAPLPPKAALIVTSDLDTFPLWYLQQVEGFRPDVLVVNRILLNHRWYREQVGCPESVPSPDMKAASVRAFLDADRQRAWFTSPAPVKGVPARLRPSAFHLTCRLASGASTPLRARGFTWRGVLERYRHIPEPHSALAVGYTFESFRYLAAISARGVY